MANLGTPPKNLEMVERFSDNFEQIRKSKHITQKMIVNAMDINQQAASNWSRGISMPTGDNLTQLAEFLGVSREKLLK